MRVIIQRVKSSSVTVEGQEIASQEIASIDRGLNLLVGISATDTEAELDWIARKCLDLRLFTDQATDKSTYSCPIEDRYRISQYISPVTYFLDFPPQNSTI
ncbi:D-aminoacyl-tRNA deacylase [Waterburya agarophytonicola K14]|uniref:D-aminoacyl-tRNA deacylase n=1 Tax=Waterburya agarophytonicola KI4 TaxID=2874699 RepID=A0A964BRY2_9CYAN|nr:D-aminoacyl-tRNA deacylase [Waterburya agarophytonicola]MCC0178104.1 D-aminoacyl-tRNA deacylase [Waterburya agarophytonicola KI4]